MKLITCLTAFAATLSLAQPVEQAQEIAPVQVPFDEANILNLNSTQLEKRANDVEFWVFTSSNCGTGGVFFWASGNGFKGNFGEPQKSFYIQKLDPNHHLTLYYGLDQSGPKNQLGQDYVGSCFVPGDSTKLGWLSWGLYDN